MSNQIAVQDAVGLKGYTTVEQARALGEHLQLSSRSRLLDVGAGSGWPGAYLAESSGCTAVSTDIAFDALVAARRQLPDRAMPGMGDAVHADARALPFRSGAFDAVVHADVLC